MAAKCVEVFRRFDLDGDGVISKNELGRVLKALDSKQWNDENIDVLLSAADTNKDGMLQYEEFVNWLNGSGHGLCGTWNQEEQLLREFSFCGYIDKAEHRGINLTQLDRVLAFAEMACKAQAWTDTAPPAYSQTSGQVLEMSFLNLYHCNTWVIMPATKEHNCSMVEVLFVDKTQQKPKWFLSHWWGEPIRDCIACLEEHAKQRGNARTDSYWICAYANRQHDIGATGLTADPKETSFYKALQLCKGVLILLDHQGPATTLTRIWCGFEDFVCATSEETFGYKLLTDIATTRGVGEVPDIIIEGLSVTDEQTFPRLRVEKKLERESKFPLETLMVGLNFSSEQAKATVEHDRIHILNSMAGRPLAEIDEVPYERHDMYDFVNTTIRGLFAKAAFAHVMRDGVLKHPRVLECLREDKVRRVVHMQLTSNMDDADVTATADNMPPNIRSFTIILPETKSSDAAARSIAKVVASRPGLVHVVIDYSGPDRADFRPTTKLTEAGASAIFESFAKLPDLRHAELNIGKNHVGPSFGKTAAETIPRLTHLHTLSLDFGHTGIKGPVLKPVFEALAALQGLKRLQFRLNGIEVSDDLLGVLARSLARMSSLEGTSMLFWANPLSVKGAAAVARALVALPMLRGVHIVFGMTAVPEALQKVQDMRKLTELSEVNEQNEQLKGGHDDKSRDTRWLQKVILVEACSKAALVFNRRGELTRGESVALTFEREDKQLAIVPGACECQQAGPWSFIELCVGEVEDAVQFRLDDNRIVRAGDRLELHVPHLRFEPANNLILLTGPVSTIPLGARNYLLNDDGTISPQMAPHLVLGSDC